jgi:magnesium transporter
VCSLRKITALIIHFQFSYEEWGLYDGIILYLGYQPAMAIKTLSINNGSDLQWIDVTDPDEKELLEIGRQYNINRHIIRDCLDPDHLPKHERQNHYFFLIVRLFRGNPRLHVETLHELTTKIAIFFSEEFLITIHRVEQPFLGRIKVDELDKHDDTTTANLVARIVQHVLATYEHPAIVLGEEVDVYETTMLLKRTKPAMLRGLYYIKRKAATCRKMLLLTDDVVSFLRSTKADEAATQDVRDLHTKLLMLYDEVLDDVSSLMNTYLSLTAQKTNDVMKVLTIFSVFFMPLTFIVGIYGMNFRFMPELEQRWGYPVTLGVMAVITIIIFFWFKKRKWL